MAKKSKVPEDMYLVDDDWPDDASPEHEPPADTSAVEEEVSQVAAAHPEEVKKEEEQEIWDEEWAAGEQTEEPPVLVPGVSNEQYQFEEVEYVSVDINMPTHEVCAMFPPMSDEEFSGLKGSVRMIGFRDPVLFWEDADGDPWLVDGANRRNVYNELQIEGVDKAENGDAIKLKFVKFVGDESDLIEMVMAKNDSRRHLKPSQRAAMVVRSEAFLDRYAAKAGKTREKPNGYVELLAARHGVNRTYLYDCFRIYETNPDVFEQIAIGRLNVGQAIRQMAAIELAARRKEAPEANVITAGDPTARGGRVYDGLKKLVIDEDLLAVFRECNKVHEATRSISAAISAVTDLSTGPAGHFISVGDQASPAQEIISDLRKAYTLLKQFIPYSQTCPVCLGTCQSQDPDDKGGDCKQCEGQGWVDKARWDSTPKGVRAQFTTNSGGVKD